MWPWAMARGAARTLPAWPGRGEVFPPHQQFANLYWFRYDGFNREDFKQKLKDIYAHHDYGKKAPDLGWRFTAARRVLTGIAPPRG
jgi:hypothetical protein